LPPNATCSYGPAEETRAINETRSYTITFSRGFKSLGIIDTELACQVNQCDQHWKSLPQPMVSVIKFIADRGLGFRGDDENVGSSRNFFQANFQTKEVAMLLVTGL